MAFLPYGIASTSFVVGNGSDGSLSTSGNVSLTSTLDGDAVVKQYTSLTVNSGHTLTVSNRCKGLHIYVQGDLVLNGTISMTARGASASNADQIITSKSKFKGIFSLQEWDLLKRIYNQLDDISITASTVNGGSGVSTTQSSTVAGNNGSHGVTLFQCGGGGSGAIRGTISFSTASGDGGKSTFFSGGAGSGGAWCFTANAITSNGSSSGGGGSNGVCTRTGSYGAGGGAGNPGGNGSESATAGETGTGGQLIIIVGGTLSGNGVFESKGSNGGSGTSSYSSGGGGSGGGCQLILYKNSLFTGTFNANGGSGGSGSGFGGANGGAGGNGYIYNNTISNFFEQYG